MSTVSLRPQPAREGSCMRPVSVHRCFRILLLTATALVTTTACTSSNVFIPPVSRDHPLDNKVAIDGGFCAEGAEDLQGFLKIMVIVDRSNSMHVTDPNNRRIKAVQDLVMRYVEDPVTYKLRAGVQFAVLSFFGNVIVHTRDARGLPGFSNDGPQILFSLSQIARTGSNTGYDKALAQAFLLLDTDMARLSDAAKARSRYEVIFLSDGMPFPDNCAGDSNSPDAAIAAVKRIKSLSVLHKVPLEFSTAFASDPRMFTPGNYVDTCNDGPVDPNLSIGQVTRSLLQAMANAGGGSFTQFDNGDSITFAGFNFADARRIYALSNFIVSDLNARPDIDHVEPDSDADGLTDAQELELGTSPYLADSDGDGFNDALEWRYRQSGLDPLDPTDAECNPIDRVDTDGDGLLDCEEMFLGTLRRSFDTDADGMPDNIEVLFGSNPNSANPMQDRQSDDDADGASNADEIRWHTDPHVVDVAERAKIAYNYELSQRPITTGRACYDFHVDNISLASTSAPPPDQNPSGAKILAGRNRIMLYFAQTPYDDPLAEPLYREACVDTRFVASRDLKVPPSGIIHIPSHRPSDTYRPSPVLRPNKDRCQASVDQDCGLNTLWCRVEDDGSCNCYRPPKDATESANGVLVGPCPQCSDGIDNDGDGLTDYPNDPDCFDSMDNTEAAKYACSDGIDNDGDGKIDWPADPGCDSAYDNDETDPPTEPQCADGIDNDGDGAIDFPNDPGCYAASDNSEVDSLTNPVPDCSDGVDNDGDGLVDYPADPGCSGPDDISEDGPETCFYCENYTDMRPGQCDISAGYCRPRSGIPPAGPCATDADCRGGVCNPSTGRCSPCLRNRDCDSSPGAGDGVCDATKGWCLHVAYTPTPCKSDADCGGAVCDTQLGYCKLDPYYACHSNADCRPGDLCAKSGFCLHKVFATAQCDADTPCKTGQCDEDLGWCLPSHWSDKCTDDIECPFGKCTAEGYCDQQTFVFPTDFKASVDCIKAH